MSGTNGRNNKAEGADEYRSLFPRIHFDLAWEAFAQQNWPVDRLTLVRRDELLTLKTAFRIRFGKVAPRFLKTLGSHFMSVEEALAHLNLMDERRQQIILEYREQFTTAAHPVRLRLATYRLDDRTQLILDGSHRACALASADCDFELTLYRIKGPRRFAPK